MYEEHPFYKSPENEDAKIWRYIDIPKFFWLIERKSLYFSRCDLLGDPFEGSLPSTPGQIVFTPLIRKRAAELLKVEENDISSVPSIHDIWRKACYVCSFHMNEYESAALWSLYSKANQGVAIQSTFKRLVNSFKDYSDNPVNIGTIKYINYQTEIIHVEENFFLPILHKRRSFEHENEIRAVISHPVGIYYGRENLTKDSPNKPEGINVPIDLDCFIEHIYLAPTTKPWIKELLQSMMNKNGISKPIDQSTLDADPII
jgi:hypothetical protein